MKLFNREIVRKVRFLFLVFSVYLCNQLTAQELQFKSIHQEEFELYKNRQLQLDSDSSFDYRTVVSDTIINPGCKLEKIVFGYHPYWMGDAYVNYQWHLLSDLCYFSYEVDPATGDPVTTNNWMSATVIDSAQANGVRIHLCATLFSGHSQFFSSAIAQQNLIDSLIDLVQARNADGINLDFEAVPSSYGDELLDFVVNFSTQYKSQIPDGLVSIAIPAVDWTGIYDINILNDHIDIFFIMGYDYYWNGSGQAGPVAPLYAMTGSYNYSQSRTISYYQSEKMPLSKMVLGVPYYARQWQTQDSIAPSNVTAYGAAYKYSTIKNGAGGTYSPENRRWEDHSFSIYYSFFRNNDWYQCFIHEARDFDKRYNIVNMRGLGGIGIWALGYDDGYSELWEIIADKFTDCALPVCSDTLYDSGGPYGDYFNNEDYLLTFKNCDNSPILIDFQYFDLEDGYDSLWVFAGPDTTYDLLGAFSGANIPDVISCSDSVVTMWFFSDGGTTMGGWEARWENGFLTIENRNDTPVRLVVYPNPADGSAHFSLSDLLLNSSITLNVYNSEGRIVLSESYPANAQNFSIDVAYFPTGIYLLTMLNQDRVVATAKLSVIH